jgi:hypothetical protein
LSIKFVVQLFFALVLAIFLSYPARAQQTPPAANPAPATPPQSSSDKDKDDKDKNKDIREKEKEKDKDAQSTSGQGKVAGTSNDRLFLALPNFLTLENAGNVPPLTTGQKFKVVALGSFDKIEFPWYGFLSGISQAENSEPGYGQGWKGYAKRYGSAFADGTLENFMTSAVLPSILRQDPRFFQSSEGGFTRRTGYAISRIFVTRTDSGGTQFNYSEIVGSAISAAISTNTYHPRAYITIRDNAEGMPTYVHNASDRTLPNTLSVWGTQVGYDTITIVVKEFWPDIHRRISKKRSQEAAPASNRQP